ncbi:hypothetical protein M501DRAFT_907152, partial [Patellaria atrata CBS 101060]
MGNTSTKEQRPPSSHSRPVQNPNPSSPTTTGPSLPSQPSNERPTPQIYTTRSGRGSRHDLSFLGLGRSDREEYVPVERRETKAEREARKLEKERIAREKERERSMREESVDGGYLVTLGVYTGPEDFSKRTVRQLMIERRLAPFWRGLNDHSESWTEYQLVSAARGLPVPPADEVPPEDCSRSASRAELNPQASNLSINHLTVPITSRSPSYSSDMSNLGPSHPAFSLPAPVSPINAPSSSGNPFSRGRAKTLAALTTSSRNNSQTEMTPQEIHLPKDPYVNGQKVEAFLYKDAMECPICFMYYPPYLNKTRCCDQPICSECFVQIKRPDPHPPEHHDPNNPEAANEPQDDFQLVSEPAACPFCVQPEFGVTYESPPFRRGLAYPNHAHGHGLGAGSSAMSSSTSLTSGGASPGSGGRRRTTSLSASAPTVITTDRVRPDWAKKLSDARAHALRRSAAATALHNAAYVLGNQGDHGGRGFALGRRRRTIFNADSASTSGHGTPRPQEGMSLGNMSLLLAERNQSSGNRQNEGDRDLYPDRGSSRRNRMEDLEDLMMMEAIRLSLAAEEERKRKEEKDQAKEAKKEEKQKAKEAKKAAKAARKAGSFGTMQDQGSSSAVALEGKGKGVDRSGAQHGSNTLSEPTSTLNTGAGSSSKGDAQRHLENSRAQISGHQGDGQGTSHRMALRQLSSASSSVSSFVDSIPDSNNHSFVGASSFDPSPNASGLNVASSSSSTHDNANGKADTMNPGADSLFNFRSLSAMISQEDEDEK